MPLPRVPIPESGTRRKPVDCGNLPFVIRRDGTWLYRGSPINRKELVCLFASVLKRADDGAFLLETPVERGRIEVEDAPFTAVELDWTGCGRDQRLTFRTNVDQLVTADAEHPIRVAHDLLTCRPTPYLRVREGAGHWPLEARICRAVYYELAALAEPGQVHGRDVLGVWSCGCFFPLGEAEADGRHATPRRRSPVLNCVGVWSAPPRPRASAGMRSGRRRGDPSSPPPCWCRLCSVPFPACC